MNKTFDIRKIKQKKGRVIPAILPRASGKTNAILDTMEKDDLCVTPLFHTLNMAKSKYGRWVNYENRICTENGDILVMKTLFSREILGHGSYKTVYVDDFLFYNDREIETFIRTILEVADNAIMISSDSDVGDGLLPRIFHNKSIYYDKIGDMPNIINLPDSLFVL